MRYKTRFPESYDEGRVNITLSISAKSFKLLQEIDNASAYINDLVYEDMKDGKSIDLKLAIADINKHRDLLLKNNMDFKLFRIPDERVE